MCDQNDPTLELIYKTMLVQNAAMREAITSIMGILVSQSSNYEDRHYAVAISDNLNSAFKETDEVVKALREKNNARKVFLNFTKENMEDFVSALSDEQLQKIADGMKES